MSATTATKTAEYELVLMLDPEVPDERRDQIADEARKRITSGGDLKHDQAWGMRKMAYEIRQRTEADYRFFRFEGQSPLLDELDHSLKIADGVLRFRIFKVDPRSPAIEPPPPISLGGASSRGGPPRRGGPSRPAVAETEAPDSPPAEAPAEPTPAQEPAETPPAPDSPPAEAPAEPGPAPEAPDSPPAEAEAAPPADAPEGDEPGN